MTTTTCETVRDLLIDYSDDELDAAASTVVRDHLKGCSVCRDELDRLQRSLEHAQLIWRDSAVAAPSLEVRSLQPKYELRKAFAIAAALSAVVAGVWLLRNPRWNESGPVQRQVIQHEQQPAADETALDMSDIASLIAQEAQSARLAASSQLLADHPSLADYSQHADTYLATVYKNSSAGAQARQRLVGTPASSDTGTLP